MKSLIKFLSALSVSLFVSVACAQDMGEATDTTDASSAAESSEQLNEESTTRSPASVSTGEEVRHPRAGMDANSEIEAESAVGSTMGQTFTKPQIRDVQSALSDRGFDVGVDGVMGPQTQDALRRFQSEQGLEQSGMVDQATLRALNIESDMERAPASVPEESGLGTESEMGGETESQSETDL